MCQDYGLFLKNYGDSSNLPTVKGYGGVLAIGSLSDGPD